MVICVFGASSTWGAWDKERGGWVNRLRLFLENGNTDTNVYNLGVSGDTTEDLLKRLDCEAGAREAELVIFSIGDNDSAYENKEGNYQVPPEKFKKNLLKLIKIAGKFADKIIFLGLKPVDEFKTKPVLWHDVIYYTNKNIDLYDSIIKDICGKCKIGYIDIKSVLDKNDLADGLHPNENGHQKIFEAVKDHLFKNKLV